MKKYISRLSAPSRTDKRFINYNYGGYNTCIVINKETGYVMPNCVGYAHGRLLEILEENSVNWKLPACNAEDWYEKAQNAGFSVGSEPKLGAVACWKSGQLHNGSDGAGHVAVVEEIKANGDIIVSASGYGGTEFYTQSIPKASGYVYMDGLEFVGFIYCGIEFESTNDDLNSNTIPNRFKVVNKDGKQINAYTNYSYARKFADANNAVIIDSVNATQVYPTNKEDEKPDAIIPPTSENKGIQADVFSCLSEAETVPIIGNLCKEDMKKSGILASISAAQFILESGYGKTELAQRANNCFGMKTYLSGNTWGGSSWDGVSYVTIQTKEQTEDGTEYTVIADFRKYPCIEDSIADHSAYLLGAMDGDNLRYPGIKGMTDYRAVAQLIKDGDYATDIHYVDKLCNIIERWNLTKYDIVVDVPETPDIVKDFPNTPFMVRVIIDDLNYYSEPSTQATVNGQTGIGTFTIVEVKDGWGKLKSGAGWVWLGNPSYCTICDPVSGDVNNLNDFNSNTIENRFKVVNKDGKQIGAYTKYSYACETAKDNNAVVIDSVNGKQIYPDKSVREELTATSYPDYTDGSTYKVMTRYNNWDTSKGAFSIWKNAFNKWSACKNDGYHIYDKNGNQLD